MRSSLPLSWPAFLISLSRRLGCHVVGGSHHEERDAKKMRGARPFVFTNLKTGSGVDTVVRFIQDKGGLGA